MKGIILAGGSGSRLYPLTKITNKHLLPVYNKPMICYPLEKLIECGIKDVMIVSGKGHTGHFLELLGSGKDYNINITYEIQDGSDGIANALDLCEQFVGKDNAMVILGDNIVEDNLNKTVKKFRDGAHIFLKEVDNPERFGVATIDDNYKLIEIIEKPKNPVSKYAITGIYLYDYRVFKLIKTLQPSNRGEYEITDINNMYLKMGEINYSFINGFWSDAGTFDSLYNASSLIRNKFITNKDTI